jgi:hypothetical protein
LGIGFTTLECAAAQSLDFLSEIGHRFNGNVAGQDLRRAARLEKVLNKQLGEIV